MLLGLKRSLQLFPVLNLFLKSKIVLHWKLSQVGVSAKWKENVNSTRNWSSDFVEGQGLELLTPESPASQLLNWEQLWWMQLLSMSFQLLFVSNLFFCPVVPVPSLCLLSVQIHHLVWQGVTIVALLLKSLCLWIPLLPAYTCSDPRLPFWG